MSNRSSPSFFMCIGAQKTGTTWLYHNLKEHPEIALSSIKELHFFDGVELQRRNNIRRLFSGHHLDVRWRKHLKRGIISILKFSDLKDSFWIVRYTMTTRSLSRIGKYKSLLRELGNNYSYVGDITPEYSTLSKGTVDEIYKNFPELKVIFVMRNPVERDWSQFRMTLRNRKMKLSEINPLSFYRHNLSSDYMRTIRNWAKYYNLNQMHIGFYEELQINQLYFLNSIIHYFGLTPFKDVPKTNKFNPGVQMQIPVDIERVLYQKYEKLIAELSIFCQRFKINYAKRWEQKMHKVLHREF